MVNTPIFEVSLYLIDHKARLNITLTIKGNTYIAAPHCKLAQ